MDTAARKDPEDPRDTPDTTDAPARTDMDTAARADPKDPKDIPAKTDTDTPAKGARADGKALMERPATATANDLTATAAMAATAMAATAKAATANATSRRPPRTARCSDKTKGRSKTTR
jgi:hypothetical protein